MYPLLLRGNSVFQQQNQATHLKSLLPLLIFIYRYTNIYMYFLYSCLQFILMLRHGVLVCSHWLPFFLPASKEKNKWRGRNVILHQVTLFIYATYIYRYQNTYIYIYIKMQLWTQGAQLDVESDYPKVVVNLCPSAVTSVVKWHKIPIVAVVYNGQFSLEKQQVFFQTVFTL